ncbi:MAG: hypothetical protein ACHQVS_03810 [Candidatus Babeliales bacterium]
MNTNRYIALCMLALSINPTLFTTGWGTESNVSGSDKNKTNIYGILETNKDKLSVDNISFGGIFKDIPVYELPAVGDYDPDTRALKKDPTTKFVKVDMHLVTKNDNRQIVEIRVDKPDIIWSYKDATRSYPEKVEYIEMTFKACDGSERTYLIDVRKKLICNQKKAPFERMEVPLAGIKKLSIEGAKPREDKENCACDVTPACDVTKQSEPNPIDENTSSTSARGAGIAMPVSGGISGGAHFAPGMHVGK